MEATLPVKRSVCSAKVRQPELRANSAYHIIFPKSLTFLFLGMDDRSRHSAIDAGMDDSVFQLSAFTLLCYPFRGMMISAIDG
jgi:hypothetical protein